MYRQFTIQAVGDGIIKKKIKIVIIIIISQLCDIIFVSLTGNFLN